MTEAALNARTLGASQDNNGLILNKLSKIQK